MDYIYTNPISGTNEDLSRHLYIKNTGSEPLVFKVKTTAPKLFCVRPNLAIVEPGAKHEITIMRLGLKESATSSHKDKFLLLSAPVDTDKYNNNLSELWSYVEETAKDKLQTKKVKVVYQEENNAAADSTVNESVADYTADDISAGGAADVPAAGAVGTGVGAASVGSSDKKINGASYSSGTAASQQDGLKARTAASENAQKEILSETQQLKKSTTPASAVKKQTTITETPGVPLKLVFLLVILAFFVGWKFL